MTERKGDWFQTYPTRKMFYVRDPWPEDVDILDIAHSLALQTRYGGHCAYFYSVAEHSVLLSYLVPAELAFETLMHDSPEAYTGDVIRPIKESFGDDWHTVEEGIEGVVRVVFGLGDLHHPIIEEYDNRILNDERAVLQAPILPGKDYGEPLGVTIHCWSWDEAERRFLTRFEELSQRRQRVAPAITKRGVAATAEETPIPKFLKEPRRPLFGDDTPESGPG